MRAIKKELNFFKSYTNFLIEGFSKFNAIIEFYF